MTYFFPWVLFFFLCFVTKMEWGNTITTRNINTSHSAQIQTFFRVIHPCALSSFQSKIKVWRFDILVLERSSVQRV